MTIPSVYALDEFTAHGFKLDGLIFRDDGALVEFKPLAGFQDDIARAF